MSGFGLWNPLERGKTPSPLAATLGLILALTFVAACASPKPEPTPTPSPLPTATPSAKAATPSPPPTRTATVELPAPADLQALPSIADLVEKSRPWVVSITTESFVRGFFADFTNEESGSGIIARPDGYVVTNYHVIEGARDIKVHLPNGESYPALIVGRDNVTDLAVLKINAKGLPAAKFGDSDALRVGDWVITIGNALALKGGPTVTLGIVSGLDRTISTEERRQYYDLIQTDAAINTGNSGGPLVNMAGEVVGINQARLPRAQGVGFAIGASTAVPIIQSLVETGRVERPRIGFNGEGVTPANADALNLGVEEGVIVTLMSRDGPAYRAGIRLGDVVTKMDDVLTPDVESWLKLLWSYEVGDEVNVEFVRNGEVFNAVVKLAERVS